MKPVIGISMGDPNGIGPEIIVKSLDDKRILEFCTPLIFGSSKLLSFLKKNLNKNDFNFHITNDTSQVRNDRVNVFNSWEAEFKINYGEIDKEAGKFALASLEAATVAGKAGDIDAIVTAPISKYSILSEEFKFPGHTEYLAEHFSKDKEGLMILAQDDLRVALCTGHIPVSQISNQLNKELIVRKINLMAHSLKIDFGIRKPRIAVLALNPHSGDNGAIGREEIEIINPAIESVQGEKYIVQGPFAADGFFGQGTFKSYDGVLAMYHDQGLAPFKALSAGDGTNFTAGLSIIRTSPDHGTAMNIAGKDMADPSSMRISIYYAIDRLRQRKGETKLAESAMK